MSAVVGLLAASAVFAVGIATGTLSNELHGLAARLAPSLIRRAAARRPEEEREAYEDENLDMVYSYMADGLNLTALLVAFFEFRRSAWPIMMRGNVAEVGFPLGSKGERTKFSERPHWAVLVGPFVASAAFLPGLFVWVLADGRMTLPVASAIVVYAIATVGTAERRAVRAIFVVVKLGLLAAGVPGAVVLAASLSLAQPVLATVRWLWFDRFYITNRRVARVTGILRKNISTVPLERITDINYRSTVPGELLSYGQMTVETASADRPSSLRYLPRPRTFYEMLIDLATAAVGSVSIPPEAEGKGSTSTDDDGRSGGVTD